MTTATVERMLPLYEAKMLDAYDHRDADVFKSATAEKRQNQPRYLSDLEKSDPFREAIPIAWVREEVVRDDLPLWLAGFSDVTSSTNERTVKAAALPRAGVANSYPLIVADGRALLLTVFNSFVFDYVARMSVAGLHINFFLVKQLPALAPSVLNSPCSWGHGSTAEWLSPRVAYLSCTSWSMAPMAEELTGTRQVFPWSPDQRELVRAEIDAAMFHLYGVSRDDVDYIMDAFPSVKKDDEMAHGEYLTKRLILEVYDAMQTAIDTGVPYQSIVDMQPLVISPDERRSS
ncbi:MAG: hypothetical protein LBI33_00280 [Propionibacteriaceae bacterium]|jgi:hypothetical protein|nr:hypothetical protein [Propionibacteriaceae bacterium]